MTMILDGFSDDVLAASVARDVIRTDCVDTVIPEAEARFAMGHALGVDRLAPMTDVGRLAPAAGSPGLLLQVPARIFPNAGIEAVRDRVPDAT